MFKNMLPNGIRQSSSNEEEEFSKKNIAVIGIKLISGEEIISKINTLEITNEENNSIKLINPLKIEEHNNSLYFNKFIKSSIDEDHPIRKTDIMLYFPISEYNINNYVKITNNSEQYIHENNETVH